MTELSKRFEKLIFSYYHKQSGKGEILPVKTAEGIWLNHVLITNHSTLKDIIVFGDTVYAGVNLNEVAIAIAKRIVKKQDHAITEQLYRADQDYGKWLSDWLVLKESRARAVKSRDYDRVDILDSRLFDARLQADHYKKTALSLIDRA